MKDLFKPKLIAGKTLEELNEYSSAKLGTIEGGKTTGILNKEKIGHMSFVGSHTSAEMQSQNGKKGGKKTKESGKLKENLAKATKKAAENKAYLKANKASLESPNNMNKQRWLCEDGKETSLPHLKRYCNKHGLDINKCIRIL